MITIRPGPNTGTSRVGLSSGSSEFYYPRFRRGNLHAPISRLVRISTNLCLYLGVRVICVQFGLILPSCCSVPAALDI